MKKPILLFSLFSFIFSLGITFGYSSEDVSNATYLADKGIILKQRTTAGYKLDNKILRQEVIAMALKIKGITLPENYKCKKYFSDVTSSSDWVCRAIEIAADNGIITRENKNANPKSNVTRAEALAMMYRASGLTPLRETSECTMLDKDATSWQKDLINKIYATDITIPGGFHGCSGHGGASDYFYPNRLATRAEVFAFVKGIFNNSSTNSYEGFTANFGGDDNLGENWYNFGESYLNSNIGKDFYITVELRNGANIIEYSDEPISRLEKKYWSSNVYYVFRTVNYVTIPEEGRCSIGNLIFLTEKYIVRAAGSCDKTTEEIERALVSISFQPNATVSLLEKDVLRDYYNSILAYPRGAYFMRSPAGVSLETFESWYKNTESVTFREDTLKSLGDNTYEFFVDMVEGGKKSTYKVKSKVNLEKFTIDNISSVKQ